MNKIINIHLAGRLIPVDEAAYERLHQYIGSLKAYFSSEPGGEEIIHDMEDRIGELFDNKIRKGSPCITVEDVQGMISIMGSPEQILHETGEENTSVPPSSSDSAHAAPPFQPAEVRRLYRSDQEKVIGGVCGGLGMYMNTDPAILRILFAIIGMAWGTGIFIYILLWILLPVYRGKPFVFKKRLYRNPRQKIIAGVCSGLAAYMRTDPIYLRIFFLLPLLGISLFGFLNDSFFFFPAFAGGLPTLFILYIILWISIPEANTVTEKLEMQGTIPDVHNISQAIKKQADQPEPSPKKPVSEVFAILLKGLFLLILSGIIFFLGVIIFTMLAGILGMASISSFLFPLTGLISDHPYQPWLLWIFGFIVLIVPCILLIRLVVRILQGRPGKNRRWLNITLIVLFITAVFGLFYAAGSIAGDFKSHYEASESLHIEQPARDTLYIMQEEPEDQYLLFSHFDIGNDNGGIRFVNDSSIAIGNISIQIIESADSLYHISLLRSSYGSNRRRAERLSLAPTFHYRQNGDTLFLPKDFILPEGIPFRGQQMHFQLRVPRGKSFYGDALIGSSYSKRSFSLRNGRIQYHTYNYQKWNSHTYYKMGDE